MDIRSYLQMYSSLESISIYYGKSSRFSRDLRSSRDRTQFNTWLNQQLTLDEDFLLDRFMHWRPDDACPTIKAFACRDRDMSTERMEMAAPDYLQEAMRRSADARARRRRSKRP